MVAGCVFGVRGWRLVLGRGDDRVWWVLVGCRLCGRGMFGWVDEDVWTFYPQSRDDDP